MVVFEYQRLRGLAKSEEAGQSVKRRDQKDEGEGHERCGAKASRRRGG